MAGQTLANVGRGEAHQLVLAIFEDGLDFMASEVIE